ncbi:hypothetical protein [Flavihumibacter sp. UBA7668]|uniref:hypothetical protein n=1 Tax=Flavihumibacter sp. UBA7668 TaxID=1946542 RepID=UPI0025BC5909|nr:hypothetical protein [Flavihumibacter sp. UBA7668]
MNPVLTPDLQKVLEAVHYRPAVSIVLPFNPKMTAKDELLISLKTTCDQVEKSLLKQYPPELALLLLQRLKGMFQQLNYSTHKRSIAIFISPVFEKLLYLDMDVVSKVIIDDSFEIRDLINCKKISRQFLVLLFQPQQMHILLGEPGKQTRILSTHIEYSNEVALKQADQTLGQMIRAYNLPAFILGASVNLEDFRKVTMNTHTIIDLIPFAGTERDSLEIEKELKPYFDQWSSWQQTAILLRLSAAELAQRLTIGMSEVWKEAMHHNGKLLVVERDFYFDGFQLHNPYSYIKDAVDDIIEKVLEVGGEVEFVDPGKLTDFGKIALVRFY